MLTHAVGERIFHWLGRDAKCFGSVSSAIHVSTRHTGHSVVVPQLVGGRAGGVFACARGFLLHFAWAGKTLSNPAVLDCGRFEISGENNVSTQYYYASLHGNG